MDTELTRHAVSIGVNVLFRTDATLGELLPDGRQVKLIRDGAALSVSAQAVMAASGLASNLFRNEPDFQTRISRKSKIGVNAILSQANRGNHAEDTWRDHVIYMVCGKSGYVGMVRLEDGTLDVAGALDPQLVKDRGDVASSVAWLLSQADLELPGLHDAEWKGTAPLTRRTKCVATRRLFVIGDSAGYVEPFTGEGMAWALMSGHAVAPIAAASAREWNDKYIEQWNREYRRCLRSRQRTCRWIAKLLRRPILVGTAIKALSKFPSLATPMIQRIQGTAPAEIHA